MSKDRWLRNVAVALLTSTRHTRTVLVVLALCWCALPAKVCAATHTAASCSLTCKPGVAYWATDKGGNWNTTNDAANDGALYKCTAPNTWMLYYVPYTYPHPLRQTE
ncbi:MAG: hypothetical protein H8E44_40675 [Planctomycetes bacterium]|nr:hypothetical protein [Planctomycetota bacterium]MBL7041202.1 hypothetical protein [Pirellulaceae bacterium]